MSKKSVRLYNPGPINVSDDTFKAMSAPMIGHRGNDFVELYEDIHPKLQALFGTEGPVYLSTSSAWGVMEAAVRNLTQKKVLNCCNGAFSDKWLNVSERCGIDAEALTAEWGAPISPSILNEKLAEGEFDLVTLIHNETSTGVTNPLNEIAEVVSHYPDVLLVVDTVSSFSATPINTTENSIDVVLTGSQKALALPPGLALFTVSEKALERAKSTSNRGYYFDFLEFHKYWGKMMTPSTPCISLLYGLQHQLNKIFNEGLDERYTRHIQLNSMVHDWVEENNFQHFAPEGYRSKSLTCVANNLDIDVPSWISSMREKHSLIINGGYGKIKGTTFRISNMGDETKESIASMLEAITNTLPLP
ncbi:MAG: alanine--glyoxylate aminotransferase family protein [Verrucomicrobiota bacterium]|nr:alanine--glyoxylate aminotransferase family protein [Verrucomicrobiota bacterium]